MRNYPQPFTQIHAHRAGPTSYEKNLSGGDVFGKHAGRFLPSSLEIPFIISNHNPQIRVPTGAHLHWTELVTHDQIYATLLIYNKTPLFPLKRPNGANSNVVLENHIYTLNGHSFSNLYHEIKVKKVRMNMKPGTYPPLQLKPVLNNHTPFPKFYLTVFYKWLLSLESTSSRFKLIFYNQVPDKAIVQKAKLAS